MTKAFLIDSASRSVREVTVSSLKDMQAFVGGYIEIAASWQNGDTLYVDEEGMFKAQEHWFRISARPDQPLAGNGLVVGSDDDGDNADVITSLAEITAQVTFYTRTQVEAWAKGNASEPAMTFTTFTADGEVADHTVITRIGEVIGKMPKED